MKAIVIVTLTTILTLVNVTHAEMIGMHVEICQENIPTFSSFDPAYKIIRSHEGYYSNVTNDIETYAGITRKYNGYWPGWDIIDQIKDTQGSIKYNQKIDKLEYLVYTYYLKRWLDLQLYRIQDQAVANYVFDSMINLDKTAIKGVRRALRDQGFNVEVNRKLNLKLIETINQCDGQCLLQSLVEHRVKIYHKIVARHPNKSGFLHHWIERSQPEIYI